MGTGQSNKKSSEVDPPRFLVTGALGQIGMELVPHLREMYGDDNVIASDIKFNKEISRSGPFVYSDVQDSDSMARIVLENGVTHIIHLASLLSAIGERNPQLALKVNMNGIQNALELAKMHNLAVYSPSTIGVFGPTTPRDKTADSTIKEPSTMYGITKVHLELLGEYYHKRYGVDFRSIRYPGIISSKAMPGGGTTDYAVDIYHEALKNGKYTCFLEKDAALPMLYMPDCIKATVDLITVPRDKLTQCVYNVTAMSFTPEELAKSVEKIIPGFEIDYQPDFRQKIAETWPKSLDDSLARRDWGWKHQYDVDDMSKDMIENLRSLYE